MSWYQEQIQLPTYSRGCHLITDYITRAIPLLSKIETGLLHVFILHTSASLTINENADPDVPLDLASSLDALHQSSFLIFIPVKGRMICLHMSKAH